MTIMLKVAPNGRVCIPASVRDRLGVKDGGAVFLEETDQGYVLKSHMQRVREVQERLAPYRDLIPTVDEFIQMRREEAAREEEEYRRQHGD